MFVRDAVGTQPALRFGRLAHPTGSELYDSIVVISPAAGHGARSKGQFDKLADDVDPHLYEVARVVDGR